MAGDRRVRACVDLPQVVEGISPGEYLMILNEIQPKLWDKSNSGPGGISS